MRTGSSGGPDFLRELTRRGLLDRVDRSSNAYRADDSFDGGESDVPVGFGSVEHQIHPDDHCVAESDFGILKGLKCHIPVFDGKTTS